MQDLFRVDTTRFRRGMIMKQSFGNWSVCGNSDGNGSSSCLNLIGLLHTKNEQQGYAYRPFIVPDTLVLQGGSLVAWFFSSAQNHQILCKNRKNLNVENVIDHFGQGLNSIQRSRASTHKVAYIYKGPLHGVQYLTLTDLQNYLEHKSISDGSYGTAIIQKIPQYSDPFDIVKVTWVSGRCVVESKRGVDHEYHFDAPVEEQMLALDAFIEDLRPIKKGDQSRSLNQVHESWLSPKIVHRVRTTCDSIVAHVEQVSGTSLKRLVCMFKVGSQNELSYLFPTQIDSEHVNPPQSLLDMIAQTEYKLPEKKFVGIRPKKQQNNNRIEVGIRDVSLSSSMFPTNASSNSQRTLVTMNTSTSMRSSGAESDAKPNTNKGKEVVRPESAVSNVPVLPTSPEPPEDWQDFGQIQPKSAKTSSSNGSKNRQRVASAPEKACPKFRRENPVRKIISAYSHTNKTMVKMEKWWKSKTIKAKKPSPQTILAHQERVESQITNHILQHKQLLDDFELKVTEMMEIPLPKIELESSQEEEEERRPPTAEEHKEFLDRMKRQYSSKNEETIELSILNDAENEMLREAMKSAEVNVASVQGSP